MLVTETEWQEHRQPVFELYGKRGFFCRGIPVVGYSLQPLAIQDSLAVFVPTVIRAGDREA